MSVDDRKKEVLTCRICGVLATHFVFDTTVASSVISPSLKAAYCQEHGPKVTMLDERITHLIQNLPAPNFPEGLPPQVKRLFQM